MGKRVTIDTRVKEKKRGNEKGEEEEGREGGGQRKRKEDKIRKWTLKKKKHVGTK